MSISDQCRNIIKQKRLKIGFHNLASGNINQMAEEGKIHCSHPLGKDFRYLIKYQKYEEEEGRRLSLHQQGMWGGVGCEPELCDGIDVCLSLVG